MAKVQLQIVSDLHLESPAVYDIYNINPKAPFLALLGDIGYVKDEGFFIFLRRQLAKFKVIFLVLGNHEPYHSSWKTVRSKLRDFQASIDNASKEEKTLGKFVLLDQTRYDISPNVSILGCTLFSAVSPEQRESVNFGLNDFYHIDEWSVDAHREAHLADVAWLNSEINSIRQFEPNRTVIVLTHYCPVTHENVIDPRHRTSNISSGFMTDLTNEQCWKSEAVTLWAFGHTHFNCDYQDPVTGKRVMSNQRGYYFAQSAGFDGEKTIEL